MDIKVFEPNELEVVLRALRAVAVANGSFTVAERDFLSSVSLLHGVRTDPDELTPVAFEDVARVVQDPHRRKRAVQLAVVMALVEGESTEAGQQAVRELAQALDIADEGVTVLYDLSRGHAFFARIDMMRRIRRFMQDVPGFPGALGMVRPFLGLAREDRALRARYEALSQCGKGTLGRAFYDHYANNAFPFPGDNHGIPDGMIFHDVGHVLSGYGVDPEGEIQQAGFQAGFTRRDGFVFLLFGILQFHLGIRLTPIAKSQRSLFDVQRVLRAVARGAACKVDLSEGFDLFAHADEQVDELRERLGIPAE